MEFKIIRTYGDRGVQKGPLKVQKCSKFGELDIYSYHVHLLRRNYNDHENTPYLCDLNNHHNENDARSAVISKLCYAPYNQIGGTWGVIASTLSSLDLPSLDESILNLVSGVETNMFDFTQSLCGLLCTDDKYIKELQDGISREENNKNIGTDKFIHRPVCSFFDTIKPYNNAAKDIKFFWKNNKLFVLRRYNNKIYEGYQWLKLSEEEKEQMLK